MLRTQIERQYLGQFALLASGIASPTFDFPLGELWYGMNLRIAATLTLGGTLTNNVAYDDPLLEIINQIRLEVNRDGVLVDVPAKALFRRATVLSGTPPNMDEATFVATTGAAYAMSVNLPIHFADPLLLRPEDTALATDRYDMMRLTVGLGAGIDALSTANGSGTYVLSALTCDVEILKLQGAIPDGARPEVVQKFLQEGNSFNVASLTSQSLSKSVEKALKRLFIGAHNLAVSGRPWSGNGNNAIIVSASLLSDQKNHIDALRDSQIQDWNKTKYAIETWPTGLYVFDFAEDGSLYSSLSTGDKSLLEYRQTNEASLPSGNNFISLASDQAVMMRD